MSTADYGPSFVDFHEAVIAWATNRGVILPDEFYHQIPAALRNRRFSIAGLASLDQIKSIQDSLLRVLAEGSTFRDWQNRIRAGEIPLCLPQHRLDNIFRTNLQSAYNAGRALQQETSAALSRRPFFLYDAVNDHRTRKSHHLLDNFIAPATDPIWKTITPPNGFRCRCVRIGLTERQAAARGYRPGKRPPEGAGPDKGWEHHPLDYNRGIEQAITERERDWPVSNPAHQYLVRIRNANNNS